MQTPFWILIYRILLALPDFCHEILTRNSIASCNACNVQNFTYSFQLIDSYLISKKLENE